MTNTPCPLCDAPARLVANSMRFRRGDRVLAVEVQQWECTGTCRDPEGSEPYRFADLALVRANEARARAAWMAHFGEEMPAPKRAGRPTDSPQTERLQVRVTQDDLSLIDKLRGELSRSEFVRRAFRSAVLGPIEITRLVVGGPRTATRRREPRATSGDRRGGFVPVTRAPYHA